MRPQQFDASLHIFRRVDQCIHATIEDRPPLTSFTPFCVRSIVGWSRDRLPAEFVCMRLESPKTVTRDVWVGFQSAQYLLKITSCGPVGNIPAILAGHIDLAFCDHDRSVLGKGPRRGLRPSSKKCIPVR